MSNKAVIPQAQEALDKFKYEVANEIGVPLKQGYNGDLTSAQNGYVGGYMVKKMIEKAEQETASPGSPGDASYIDFYSAISFPLLIYCSALRFS